MAFPPPPPRDQPPATSHPSSLTLQSGTVPPVNTEAQKGVTGVRFWLIFGSLCVSLFLSALELTGVSTALPTIVQDLNGDEFVWVGSAYALGSTAILPLTGGIAQIFGRRPIVLISLAFFALGSGICGGAKSMTMLIAGRVIQGIGGGGIISLTSIVLGDMVPLHKRGPYMGVLGLVWGFASGIGPPVGGAFSEVNWRWLFYINIPLCAVAAVLVFCFLRLKVPQDDFRTKIRRMDWVGNIVVVIATTITVIALTWAGIKYPWSSFRVLVPLIIGIILTILFFVYEFRFAKEPVVPWDLVSNRTSFAGYTIVFLQSFILTPIIYYLPVYFQGSKEQSPVASGVSLFGMAFTVAPAAAICGISVTTLKRYKPQNILGMVLASIGTGLLTLLTADSSRPKVIGYQILGGLGLGFAYSGPIFAVLSPVPVTRTAPAMALLAFMRAYAQTWGVTIGATILQNQLKQNLPKTLAAQFPSYGVEIAYALIPKIKQFPEPLQTEVRVAFASSVRVIWYVFVAFAVLGVGVAVYMREIKMHEVTDEDWGVEEKPKEDAEKAEGRDNRAAAQ